MNKPFLLALLLLATGLSAQEEAPPPAPETDQVVPVAEDEALPPAPETDQVVPVAEDPVETSTAVDVAPMFTSDEEELIYQYERYISLMGDHVYDEADSVAKRVVELAIVVKGPGSTDFAKALMNLAIVQHRTEQYDAAQQNFESAIGIIEDNEDQLDQQLINPLKGLGASQLESGRPDKASASFRRAVHVSHVNMGPHNLGQVGILESLAEALLRVGALDDAKQIQDRIYALNERAYADNALEMVPSLMRRADWQRRAGFINDQRTTLRRAIRIIESTLGREDMALVEPLTELGQSFFYIDQTGTPPTTINTVSTGETHFKRALRIARENPEASWKMIADTSLALGDYYNFLEDLQQATKVYRAAWADLSEGDEQLAYRRENLERWVVLREDPFPQFVTPPSGRGPSGQEVPMSEGSVTLSYDVSEKGRAVNLKILDAEPVEFVNVHRNVQRALRRRIFRPRMVNGEPAASEDQTIVHKYFFNQEELDVLRAANAEDSEGT